MSGPPPPALLPPPPKRAPGVKRLNSVPIVIGCGAGLIFLGAIGYTMVKKHQDSQASQAAATAESRKPQGSKAPAFLAATQDHGQIQASLTKPREPGTTSAASHSPPAGTPPPQVAPPPQAAPQSGTDLDEQARVRAWNAYYQQMASLQAARLDLERKALQGQTDPFASSTGQSQIPGMAGQTGPSPGQKGVDPPPPAGSRPAPYATGGTDPAGQTGKQVFLRTPGDPYGMNEDLPGSVHSPKPNTIMEGTPIPGRLIDAATSDSPGQLVAEVLTNVYDDMTGTVLLIPQWSRIITTYDTAVSTGQERIGIIAQRLVFPDTSSRQLGSMQVADQSGKAGLKDVLNTHFWEKFGSALAVSFIGAGAQLAQPQQSAFSAYSPGSAAAGAVTQQMSQFGTEQARALSSRPNTIELRPGLQMVIKPNHDLTLPAYVDARDGGAGSYAAMAVRLGR